MAELYINSTLIILLLVSLLFNIGFGIVKRKCVETDELILRNSESAQYLYAAKKNYITKNGVVSESDSKTVIGHFSDVHGDVKRFQNCLEFFEYFGANFAIHTGDTVTWDMKDDSSYIFKASKKSKVPLYNCVGNHDTFKGDTVLTNQQIDNELGLSKQKNVVSPNGNGYYYVDFENYKLRLIALNSYDYDGKNKNVKRDHYSYSQTQCDWLIKILKDASEKGYGVIVASHESDIPIPAGANNFGFCQRYEPYPWGIPTPHSHVVSDIIDAFKHGKELKLNVTWEDTGDKVAIDTKFEKSGEFICYLNGHRHGDYVGYLSGFTDQLSIGMPPSGCFPDGYHNIGEEISDLPRIPGTVSEDCVNLYVLDRENKTISIIRMGAVVNDNFETRRALKLNY